MDLIGGPEIWSADFIGSLIRTGLQVIIITHRIDEIIPEISHVLLMTAEGVQKMGCKNEVLNSAVLQQVYRIDHDPLNPARQLTRPPADQTLAFKAGSREPYRLGAPNWLR